MRSAANPMDFSQATDIDLYLAVKAGEVKALSHLYDRYVRLVYGMALKIVGSPEEAEDVTQDIFLTLWHRHSYDPARGSLSNFLMTLTRSRSIDKLRSRGVRLKHLQQWQHLFKGEPHRNIPLEQASVQERSQRVQAALAQLPETERQVLEIAYYEGLSQSEIAKRLNTPLGTVKTRSRQALIKLRQTLKDHI